jgi:hypothetical protein
MKTIVIILSSVLIMITFDSCNQSADAKEILGNAQSRAEIFDAIANNHDFMTEFMENLKTNQHAMQMMQGSKMMMG